LSCVRQRTGQQAHVARAVAAALDRHDLQPTEQVPRAAGPAAPLARVPVRCGDHAHVDHDVVGAADARDLMRLEHAQESHLKVERHLGDLVEEQRAAMRARSSRVLARRAGEAPRLVAEQLALDQVGRHRSAVEREVRPLRACRQRAAGRD
jgi:hypothetical protein